MKSELSDNKRTIEEIIVAIEGFLRDHKDRLSPDQQDALQRRIYDLRTHFDQGNYKASDLTRKMQDQVRFSAYSGISKLV